MSSLPFPIYDDITYTDFLNNHLLPNTPFLLSSKATAHWPARSWNLTSLRKYSTEVVPVANTIRREFSEFQRTDRPLGEVLNLWENGDDEGQGLYVKDWHLADGYDVPDCFRDDWLAKTPDFGFTYVGPAGTWSPVHRDVYASYSWSANMLGRKMWWLFPPGTSVEGLFDVREDGEEGSIKLIQEEGQIIFVPTGWYHQVVNLGFCISINHNFFSSPTLPSVYKALNESQRKVENSISDVKIMIKDRLGEDSPSWEKEWVEEVQKLLEMDAGWAWRGFWNNVLENVKVPPASEALSPPQSMRDDFLRATVQDYQNQREWVMLDDVREVVFKIIDIINGQSGDSS